ncbi:MAG TPA: hypothetical protein VKD22_00030 [Ramlibacter sp.]|nr:hypothetical protein [Ramlibacter sp.]
MKMRLWLDFGMRLGVALGLLCTLVLAPEFAQAMGAILCSTLEMPFACGASWAGYEVAVCAEPYAAVGTAVVAFSFLFVATTISLALELRADHEKNE